MTWTCPRCHLSQPVETRRCGWCNLQRKDEPMDETPDTRPPFAPTGPGKYRLRNGEVVTLVYRMDGLLYPWRSDANWIWRDDGSYDADEPNNCRDIIAPVDEPEPADRVTLAGREYIRIDSPELETLACEVVTRLAAEGRLEVRYMANSWANESRYAEFRLPHPKPTPITATIQCRDAAAMDLVRQCEGVTVQ